MLTLHGVDDTVGTLHDGAADAADGFESGLAQGAVPTAGVQLRQAEFEQRQVAGFVADVVEKTADETRFEAQAGHLRGAADRPLALGAGHAAEENRRLLQPVAQRPVLDGTAGEVGAQRQHHAQRRVLGRFDESVGERRGVGGRCLRVGVQLFPLVDDQQHAATAGVGSEGGVDQVPQGDAGFRPWLSWAGRRQAWRPVRPWRSPV
jgi:hypothetical protein